MRYAMEERRLDSMDMRQLELMDVGTIDWKSVSEVTYIVYQHIRYEYPGPITDLRQRLMISPRDGHGGQRRIEQRLDVFPRMPAKARRDAFGNSVVAMVVPRLDCGIDFEYWAIVERAARITEHREPRSVLEMPSLLRSSLLTRADANLREAA